MCWMNSFPVKNCGQFNAEYMNKSEQLCSHFSICCTFSSIFSPGGKEKKKFCQEPSGQFHSREKPNTIPGHLVSCLKKMTFYLVQGRKFHDVVERSAVKVHKGLFSRERLRHSKIPEWGGTTNSVYLRYLQKIYRISSVNRWKFTSRSFQMKLRLPASW